MSAFPYKYIGISLRSPLSNDSSPMYFCSVFLKIWANEMRATIYDHPVDLSFVQIDRNGVVGVRV